MMNQKQYIIAVGEPEGGSLRSYVLSKRRLIVFLFAGFICVLLVAVILAEGMARLGARVETRRLNQENESLREHLTGWEVKLSGIQSDIRDLDKRNKQIRVTASLSLPEIEYGVGGSETPPRAGLNEWAAINKVERNFARLEAEVAWIRKSTSELENTLASKITEIAHYPSIRPVEGGWISSLFGKRIDPFTGLEENHPALDISIRPGTEVRATGAGVVKKVNSRVIKNKGYGKYITINHGYGYETLYAHLSEIFVREGQRVKRWDLIGLTGNTGKSTAPHIHYAVSHNGFAKDPLHFFLD
ncbi:MAG TPA: M23 family metallopeptidase [bacterium]|nr:M23 family metallopeptidase [bacterium]